MQREQFLDHHWRSLLTPEVGGKNFDAPSSGYSFSKVLEEERALAAGNILGDQTSALECLSIADPTWKMPAAAFAAGWNYFINDPYATRYTDNFGVRICPEAGIIKNTHEQLAAYLNRAHSAGPIRFTPDWVQYSPGSIKRALAEFIPTALFGRHTRLIFPTPGYGVIKSTMNNRGAKVIDVAMVCKDGNWDLDYDKIKELIGDSKQNSFLYVNMPHNPTGTAYGLEDWIRLFRWANLNCVTLIVDEAYHHLRNGQSWSALDVLGWESCCIVLQSVSKGWKATGLRFGWMVAHPTMIKAIRMVTDVKDSGMFAPCIVMGLYCLQHPELAEETAGRYRALHEILANGLQEAGFAGKIPQAGLCQFTPAPRSANGVVFADAIECAQWFRKNLRISLMNYQLGNNPWLRWAVTIMPVPECGLPDEAAVIKETVRRLQSVKFEF